MRDHDVVVIGGGFAGITAARELRHAGYDALVVEARDRLGGRTHSVERWGKLVELGGTWVHWHQPHVWAELTRYGIGLIQDPASERAVWYVDGRRREDTAERFDERLSLAVDRACADARTWFPTPHDLHGEAFERLDGLSVRDHLGTFEPDAQFLALNEMNWSAQGQCTIAELSAASAYSWYALAGYDAHLYADAAYTFRPQGGMRRLLESILADASPDVRLECPVASVLDDGDGVTVGLRDGGEVRAGAAVVALPVNAWHAIEFKPELSGPKRALAERGHAGHGVKSLIRVRGRHPIMVSLSETAPFVVMNALYVDDDETTLVAFGCDGAALRPDDERAIVAAMEEALPGAEVLDVAGHDWESDEFSRGTWATYRPGQLSAILPGARSPEGRLAFAGADIARGWTSMVDGAIESGLSAARDVVRAVSS